jgi:hypothetical protein
LRQIAQPAVSLAYVIKQLDPNRINYLPVNGIADNAII